jgi:hypothetical protein
MGNEDSGRRLLAQGVFFLPWIGKEYKKGFRDRPLLVLGESHYDEWDGETHILGNNFTRECVEAVCDRTDSARFWKMLEQALLNECRVDGWAPHGGTPLWDHLAFYNFVQSPVSGGPRSRPSKEAFEKSRKPFRAVIEQLRPDRVLVCGKILWRQMEEIPQGEDHLHADIRAYRLADGTKVWCLATVHPSGGYSWSSWHEIIMAFLREPGEAAGLLPRSSSS